MCYIFPTIKQLWWLLSCQVVSDCDIMDCSTPGSSLLDSLSEFAQIHVHWVSDAPNHLILCAPPLLLLHSIFPSIRLFSNELVLCIRWPKYWSFSFSIKPSNEYLGVTSLGLIGLISLQSEGLSRVFCSTTVWKHHKALYTWLSGIYFRGTQVDAYLQINQCDSPSNKMNVKIIWSSLYMQKIIWQNSRLIMIKNSQQSEYRRNIPPHNRGYYGNWNMSDKDKCHIISLTRDI